MNQDVYALSLTCLVLAVLVNRGNGNRKHHAIQLYLTALVLLCTLVAFGRL